jgi:O-antigen/teichoic acid export membrane protein
MKQFLKKAGLYALPDAVSKVLPFLIMPITTRYLSLHDFGLVALFNLCMIPFNIFSEFGTGYIINSLWFKYSERNRKELLSTLLILRLGLLAVAGAVITPLAGLIYPSLIGKDWPSIAGLFPWFLAFAVTSFVTPVFTSWVVMEGRAGQFALLGTLQSIAGSLVMLFTAMTGSYRAVIIGSVAVGIALSGVRLAFMAPHLEPAFSRAMLPVIFRLGWPIFVRSAFNQVRTKFDKLYVASLFGGSGYAVYNWANGAYRLYPTTESHLAKVFEPPYYRQLSEGRVDIPYLRRLFFAGFYLVLAGSVAFYFAGRPAISMLTNGVFTGAFDPLLIFTCLALIGTLLTGQQVPIIHAEQMRFILVTTIFSSVVGFGSCLLFVPRLGINGGALSLFLMQLVTLGLVFTRRYALTKSFIAEKDILAYAVCYWLLVGLHVFAKIPIGFPLAALLAVATWHFLKLGGRDALKGLLKARRGARSKPAAAAAVVSSADPEA